MCHQYEVNSEIKPEEIPYRNPDEVFEDPDEDYYSSEEDDFPTVPTIHIFWNRADLVEFERLLDQLAEAGLAEEGIMCVFQRMLLSLKLELAFEQEQPRHNLSESYPLFVLRLVQDVFPCLRRMLREQLEQNNDTNFHSSNDNPGR